MSCFGNAKAGKANLGERHVRSCCSFGRTTEAAILATIWHSVCRVAARQRNFARSFTASVDTLFAHASLLAHQPHQAGTVGDICLRSLLDGTGQGLRDGKSDVDPHRLVRLPYIVFGRMPLPVSIPRECCQLTRALLPPFQLNRGRRISSTKSTCFTCSRRLKKNWH